MIVKSAAFVKSASKPSEYPAPGLPEIAFAGRSNTGKSSLINTLVNRKRLVKTSSTPGRTRLLNFFTVNEDLSLVDLPGYGYARVPEGMRRQWGPMVETYLTQRSSLKGVVLIMDIRRVPEEAEQRLLAWLSQHRIPAVLVLTKADKLAAARRRKQQLAAAAALAVEPDRLLVFSAKTRLGRAELWRSLEAWL